MTFILRTPAGTFTIEPDEAAMDMVKLCIGGIWLASFRTAEEASNSVTKRETGWPDWDRSACRRMPDLPCRLGRMLTATLRQSKTVLK